MCVLLNLFYVIYSIAFYFEFINISFTFLWPFKPRTSIESPFFLFLTYKGNDIAAIIHNAYTELCATLYGSMVGDYKEGKEIAEKTLEYGSPLNIRTNRFDKTVLSSIRSDIVILDTVTKILTLMFTCNQYLVPTPAHNIYLDEEK